MNGRSSPTVIPRAPADLMAVAVGDHQVILAWTECGADGLGFRIERSDGSGSACRFSEIGRTGMHVTAFRDGFVEPRKTYSYRVHAWNTFADSSSSNVVEVTTLQADPELSADKE